MIETLVDGSEDYDELLVDRGEIVDKLKENGDDVKDWLTDMKINLEMCIKDQVSSVN